ncbi:MAG TPA: DinB family protein [Daejeonella sp.]|nr:DinB family protein [Daejeonella sp.]
MNRPQSNEFAPYYATYIDTVADNVLTELEQQKQALPEFLAGISPEKADFAYAPGKWTIKEMLGHIIDTERVMTYRAMRIARNDQTPLASFDEDTYVANAHFKDRTLASLAEEFATLRKANLFLFKSLNETELNRMGTASSNPVSVRALLFILAGHVNHHRRILEERYL